MNTPLRSDLMYVGKQKGAVLLISLIMLLLLSLLGVTGMQVTSLEEKMAGNAKDKNLAFQYAETTLRSVERSLSSNALPVFDNTKGYYSYVQGEERWSSIDWSSDAETKAYTLNTGAIVAIQPRFIVEEMPAVAGAGDSLESGNAQTTKYYRVTTHAVGATDTSVVVLQSVYKR